MIFHDGSIQWPNKSCWLLLVIHVSPLAISNFMYKKLRENESKRFFLDPRALLKSEKWWMNCFQVVSRLKWPSITLAGAAICPFVVWSVKKDVVNKISPLQSKCRRVVWRMGKTVEKQLHTVPNKCLVLSDNLLKGQEAIIIHFHLNTLLAEIQLKMYFYFV